MIITGGVNICPQETGAILMQHPDVVDVAVIGIPDRHLGEVAKALVVPSANVPPTEETARRLLADCAGALSRYKCPRSLDFLTSLPRNELGKLVKRLIPQALREGPGPFTAG